MYIRHGIQGDGASLVSTLKTSSSPAEKHWRGISITTTQVVGKGKSKKCTTQSSLVPILAPEHPPLHHPAWSQAVCAAFLLPYSRGNKGKQFLFQGVNLLIL